MPRTIGRAMRRREDPRLIAGRGRFAAKIRLSGQAHLVFVRSPQFKGAGESGTVPVPAAIANAVEDTIHRLRPDIAITELPISPLRLFEALA